MKEFAGLIRLIDGTNKTNRKVEALTEYLKIAEDKDKVWAIALLTGRRPRRIVSPRLTAEWASELAGIPGWLFEESYNITGDLSETVSLLLPEGDHPDSYILSWWMNYIMELENLSAENRKSHITRAWNMLDRFETFVFNKLISGNFRMGISRQLVIRALASATGRPLSDVSHRLMGNWSPLDTEFEDLLGEESEMDASTPYPFYLANQLEKELQDIGDPKGWQAEWKWDGIRGQIVKRNGEVYVWTRGEDLATERFPELASLKEDLPDGTVIDGEILAFREGQVLSFGQMQTRIGRKNLTTKILREVPVAFFAYDYLEKDGVDIREMPFLERRKLLEKLIAEVSRDVLIPAPVVKFDEWEDLARAWERSREVMSEGLMLKDKNSKYGSGRTKGGWWKWKVDPYSVDAVLIYAQKGSGRRAGLYTDYTFALWNSDRSGLVPFAKAYSGLTNDEIGEVNSYIRKNTLEKFGSVRSVRPGLVFEIGFEGINPSKRHKSGVAVRFPRILRWRKDKSLGDADSLEELKKLTN